MSMPEFPNNTNLTREEAINQIISSIAMEELALSHIINAEGEKLQYVLGTITGMTGPQATIEQILDVNESVRGVLQSASETQAALRSKLQTALTASTMRGATGATGPAGLVESNAFQATMVDGAEIIAPDERFVYNNIFFQSGTDITYDTATGVFTINNDGTYSFYVVTFWFYSAGYETEDLPYTVSLFADGVAYSTLSIPFTETQISSTAVVPAGTAPVQLYVSNTSVGSIGLPDVGTQSKIIIQGFKSA